MKNSFCHACNLQFDTTLFYTHHLSLVHEIEIKKEPVESNVEESVSCSICNISLPSLADLSEHNLNEHQENKEFFVCPICQHVLNIPRSTCQSIRSIQSKFAPTYSKLSPNLICKHRKTCNVNYLFYFLK